MNFEETSIVSKNYKSNEELNMKEFWDERYSSDEFIYGKAPNEYYKKIIDKLTPGKVLFLGEGEGRNAVYAAKLGWEADAYDFSDTGKEKSLKLAQENNVNINYTVTDLKHFTPLHNHYDLAVIIFLHLDEETRHEVHQKVFESIKPGGRLIFEVFEKDQINYSSGGPKNVDMLYSLEEVFEDFQDLELEEFSKKEIDLDEGPKHKGPAMVIRLHGVKE
jgi:SAM-dependent methyltransferase